jgi:hypothetical protein
MSEIVTIKPRLHFLFPNDGKFGVRNLFAGIVRFIDVFSNLIKAASPPIVK